MSFTFIKRALGLKKNVDDVQTEEFLRKFHLDLPVNPTQISKLFRKWALRLVVVRKNPSKIIFDSSLNKENSPNIYVGTGNNKTPLHELAFGSCPLTQQREFKSSLKFHDLKSSRQLLLTCICHPSSKRPRCTNSVSYARRQSKPIATPSFWSSSTPPPSPPPPDTTIAVCVFVNVDWMAPLMKSPSSGASRMYSVFGSPNDAAQRFQEMIFEHFLQISVMFEMLASTVSNSLYSTESPEGLSNISFQKPVCDVNDKINQAFLEFQRTFRDLCIPRLSRPVWSTLSLTAASKQDECDAAKNLQGHGAQYGKGFSECFNHFSDQHETMTDAFVRGCLLAHISKSSPKDRTNFLAQILTGMLMQHRGWISTIQPKSSGPNDELNWGECQNAQSPPGKTAGGVDGVDNCLTSHLLSQMGCSLHRHHCENAALLQTAGPVHACTVLFGNSSGSQQQPQRDRMLSLLYWSSYFCRPSHMLMHSQEQLPDLSVADLFDLEQHKRQRRRINSTTGRRKSSSQLSASLMAGFPQDSGISSTEELTSHQYQQQQQQQQLYSSSAGNAPNHPPAGPLSICLPNILTREQCRLAEAAAQAVVAREFSLAPGSSMYGAESSHSSSNMNHGGGDHTWTTGMHRASRQLISHLYHPVGGYDTGDLPFGHVPTASISSGVPSVSASAATGSSYGTEFTEVPLLIERAYEENPHKCWCIGDGIVSSVLGDVASSVTGGPSSSNLDSQHQHPGSVTVHYGTPLEDTSPFDCIEMGTPCHADMELTDNSSLTTAVVGLDYSAIFGPFSNPRAPQFTQHSVIGSGVLEHYTSGLALQATTEPLATFQPRLTADLLAWLRYAPSLVRRTLAPEPTTRGRKQKQQSSQSSPILSQANSFKCSALLVNLDLSTVELLTIRNVPAPGRPPNTLDSLSQRFSDDSASSSPSSETSSSTTTPTMGASTSSVPQQHRGILQPAPSVVRLLTNLRRLHESTGRCAYVVLKRLEATLQTMCTQAHKLAEILAPEISSPDDTGHMALLLKQHPEVIANLIGCDQRDLPLILAIASSISCAAAAVIETCSLENFH